MTKSDGRRRTGKPAPPLESSSPRRVATLMVSLGEELAAELLQHLSAAELEQVTEAMAEVRQVPPGAREEVLAEFEESLARGDGAVHGGPEFVRRLLTRVLGPERAAAITAAIDGRGQDGFGLLRRADPAVVAPLISQEHPQTIALILSQLESAQAAGILSRLSADLQGEVAGRVAAMERVSPEVLREVEESLREMLGEALAGGRKVGGVEVVAEILSQAGPGLERGVLERLEGRDPEVAEEVRSRLVTFEDLAGLDDRAVQSLLREIDPRDLVLSLRVAGKEVRDRFLSNLSERRRQLLLEELEVMAPVRRRDLEEAQMRVIRRVRELEEAGLVRLPRRGEDDPYV